MDQRPRTSAAWGWASWADLFPLLIALPTLAVKFADASMRRWLSARVASGLRSPAPWAWPGLLVREGTGSGRWGGGGSSPLPSVIDTTVSIRLRGPSAQVL